VAVWARRGGGDPCGKMCVLGRWMNVALKMVLEDVVQSESALGANRNHEVTKCDRRDHGHASGRLRRAR